VEWLLTGAGPDPLAPSPAQAHYTPSYSGFADLVTALELPPKIHAAVLRLPGATTNALGFLCARGAVPFHASVITGIAWAKAYNLEHHAWAKLLQGLVDAYGKTAVRQKFIDEFDAVLTGFATFPLDLLDDRDLAPRFVSASRAATLTACSAPCNSVRRGTRRRAWRAKPR
jgi:hypothetical protein